MLKRVGELLRRSRGHGRKAGARGAKAGGHGLHWYCLYPELDQSRSALLAAIHRTVDNAAPEITAPRGVAAYYSPGETIRMCVLVRRSSVESAYPEVVGGPVWPVKLREVIPWANGVEGQITGMCMGAEVSFFDTRFFANSAKYRAGAVYDFHMGALAYAVRPAEEMEAETDQGVKVSFKGAHALLPGSLTREEADIDDYWFHSPLEAEVTRTTLNGVALRGLPVILAVPNEFEMALTLYAADHVNGPGMDNVQLETDLEGSLWLQGYLAGSAEF